MRDWLTAFRPASFRGIRFEVEVEDAEGGRRVAISPIAYSDLHVDEDMGGQPQTWPITAYVVGDLADAAAIAFMAALNRRGPGTLIAPMLGQILASVPRWRLSRERSRAGYVGFDIDFVVGGLAVVPFAPVPAAPRIVAMIAAGSEMVGAAAATALSGTPAGRGESHAAAARLAGDTLSDVSRGAIMPADKATAAADTIATITRAAADPIAQASVIAAGCITVAGLAGEFGEPDEAARSFFTALPTLADASPFGMSLRLGLAAAAVLALSRRDYAAQQDARRARAMIAPAVDPILDDAALTFGSEGFAWLSEIAAIAAQELSDIAANRAPIVRVETGLSIPASLAAYQLYADAERAGELARRNRIATPSLMPVAFEALAS